MTPAMNEAQFRLPLSFGTEINLLTRGSCNKKQKFLYLIIILKIYFKNFLSFSII